MNFKQIVDKFNIYLIYLQMNEFILDMNKHLIQVIFSNDLKSYVYL